MLARGFTIICSLFGRALFRIDFPRDRATSRKEIEMHGFGALGIVMLCILHGGGEGTRPSEQPCWISSEL